MQIKNIKFLMGVIKGIMSKKNLKYFVLVPIDCPNDCIDCSYKFGYDVFCYSNCELLIENNKIVLYSKEKNEKFSINENLEIIDRMGTMYKIDDVL